jgi:hypothetical protein
MSSWDVLKLQNNMHECVVINTSWTDQIPFVIEHRQTGSSIDLLAVYRQT